MDLMLWCIVVDGDVGGEVDFIVGVFGVEINNFFVYYYCVWDGNDVIFVGENFGC